MKPCVEILRALGKGLGLVGNVEAKTAKFELEIDAERPIKFKLCAQLPSGEIVPVTLEYSNLHRWCHHCRLLSHEVETCPSLPDDQKAQLLKNKESTRDQGPYSRFEVTRNGESSKRAIVPDSRAPPLQDRRSGDHSQRENRDSVWKRIDSRYAPREDHRRDYRQALREQEKLPPKKETYNKRRYEESFASSKQREEERKGTSKQLPLKPNSEDEHLPTDSRAKQPSRPLDPHEPVIGNQHKERISTSSPEHVRERPFRLNIHKKATDDQKLKGKASDLELVSDEGSSAKKSLKFNAEKPSPLSKPQAKSLLLLPANAKEKDKSWYEQTLEEDEEEAETLNQETVISPMKEGMETVDDPDAEKILEEEDWMADDVNYDDDDLMDDDDLLIEDMEQEEALLGSVKADQKPASIDGLSVQETSNKMLEKSSPMDRSILRSETRSTQTPSSKSRPSPAKKKRGSPSPIATGVSLRQRNLLMGRASSKAKAPKNGPKQLQGPLLAHLCGYLNLSLRVKQVKILSKKTNRPAGWRSGLTREPNSTKSDLLLESNPNLQESPCLNPR
ncbi:hypothetical protein Bca4012_057434 [Brassica carinata]